MIWKDIKTGIPDASPTSFFPKKVIYTSFLILKNSASPK